MIRLFHVPLLLAILALAGCGASKNSEAVYPKEQKDQYQERYGKITGEGGIFFGGPASEKGGGSPLGVNSFLWRATLDTLSFMPIASADPFGGTIITDWYENPSAPGERFKVNALILDKTLRADGIRVSVFKQTRDDSGTWRDVPSEAKIARELENTILTRARQLRVLQSER